MKLNEENLRGPFDGLVLSSSLEGGNICLRIKLRKSKRSVWLPCGLVKNDLKKDSSLNKEENTAISFRIHTL